MKREYEISIIRIISTVFIVTCHIQQYYNINLCWWFNVGVQIFFFMSGYLLGTNTDKNSQWLFRRIKRIFVDYYIYIIVILCVYYFSSIEPLTLEIILNLLCGKTIIYGVEQLWFIRPLILCYLHIFLIEYLVNKITDSKMIVKIMGSIIILLALFFFSIEVDGHWLIVFVSGYLIRKLFNTEVCHLFIIVGTGLPTLLLSYLRISDSANNAYSVWWHVFAGIFLFMLMYVGLKNCFWIWGGAQKVKNFLDFTDKYTYDIYLTHWLFIGGYFSLLKITKYVAINFLFLLVAILLSSYVLFVISRFVNDKIDCLLEGRKK